MKNCILYEGKICNDCGECMRCDLDPNKICDNCGKCLARPDDDEFLSVVVKAEELDNVDDIEPEDEPDLDDENEDLTEEERLFNAFLDEPIDLQIPEPLEVDAELAAKWEAILADYERKERASEEPDEAEPEISLHGSRKRRKR